jgi:hypothetical protein
VSIQLWVAPLVGVAVSQLAVIDPSWPVIRMLASMNLATIRDQGPMARPSPGP